MNKFTDIVKNSDIPPKSGTEVVWIFLMLSGLSYNSNSFAKYSAFIKKKIFSKIKKKIIITNKLIF